MGPGLPLANPRQSGLIFSGKIFEAFGNWVGTEMSLDFVLRPESLPVPPPEMEGVDGNFVLNWTRGTTLQDALTETFANAYRAAPMPSRFLLSDPRAASSDQIGAYTNLGELAGAVHSATLFDSAGPVHIVAQNGHILVTDFQPNPDDAPIKGIAFTDLIGQPTWIGKQHIQVTTVLRADLEVGNRIQLTAGGTNMPQAPGLVSVTAAAYPNNFKYRASFSQPLRIQQMRQVGNSRSADAGEWVTIMNCIPAAS